MLARMFPGRRLSSISRAVKAACTSSSLHSPFWSSWATCVCQAGAGAGQGRAGRSITSRVMRGEMVGRIQGERAARVLAARPALCLHKDTHVSLVTTTLDWRTCLSRLAGTMRLAPDASMLSLTSSTSPIPTWGKTHRKEVSVH
jgi:hypothetical protein